VLWWSNFLNNKCTKLSFAIKVRGLFNRLKFIFFHSYSVQGYSQVFDIVSLELFWYGGKVDPKLEVNLKRFFSENNYLQTWSKVSPFLYLLA
jgi:hypothetical protein